MNLDNFGLNFETHFIGSTNKFETQKDEWKFIATSLEKEFTTTRVHL
jgi:hypothetical protein